MTPVEATPLLVEHGKELVSIGSLVAGVAWLSWGGRSLYGRLWGKLLSIDSHLKTLNGSVGENTRHRRLWQENPPVGRAEWQEKNAQRDREILEHTNALTIVRHMNQAQLDDLNERRAERKLPPLAFK